MEKQKFFKIALLILGWTAGLWLFTTLLLPLFPIHPSTRAHHQPPANPLSAPSSGPRQILRAPSAPFLRPFLPTIPQLCQFHPNGWRRAAVTSGVCFFLPWEAVRGGAQMSGGRTSVRRAGV